MNIEKVEIEKIDDNTFKLIIIVGDIGYVMLLDKRQTYDLFSKLRLFFD